MTKITNYFAALAVVLATAVNSGCPPRRQKSLENRVTNASKVGEENIKKDVLNKLPGYDITRVTNTPDTVELMSVTVGDKVAFYNPVNRGIYLISNKCPEKTDLVFGSSMEKPDNPFVTQIIGGNNYLILGAIHIDENGKETYRVHMIDPRTKKDKVIFEASNRNYVIRDFTSSSENEVVLEQLPVSAIQKLYGVDMNGKTRDLGRESLGYHQTRNRMNQFMRKRIVKDTRRVKDFYGDEQRGVFGVDRDLYSYQKN